MIAILNRRWGFFQVELRAKIWHHMRQSVPLLLPINKDGFHGMREEKLEAKV
jgi:hypothetical protein